MLEFIDGIYSGRDAKLRDDWNSCAELSAYIEWGIAALTSSFAWPFALFAR
jgi:hypothetical protein